MFLYFKENRLCVGVRRRDWSKVWYEPIGNPDNDGTAPIGLFSSSNGMRTREPMEGEVSWVPALDPKTFESELKRERHRMQMQFLYDTYRYMAEKDEVELARLEDQLHQPGYARWHNWFRTMKAEKRERARRRERRVKTIAAAGIGPEDVDLDSDVSELEGDSDRPPLRRAGAVNTSGVRRKRPAGGPNRSESQKRPRLDAGRNSTSHQGDHDSHGGDDGGDGGDGDNGDNGDHENNTSEGESDADDSDTYDNRPPQVEEQGGI